ncbi:MAG: 30S ribosomal protein S13 [Candidatus Marsarchaeota archaeon]|jgi:small subunit ribosomal protein S13|nr:30S ribosomal protein S13 [Candidatus Marsarchaeota archaeon]
MAEEKNAQGNEKQHGRKESSARLTSVIRIAGKDVNGSLSVERAIDSVKGIGRDMARAISHVMESKLDMDPKVEIGSLDEEGITKLEALIKDPQKYGIPKFMLNRNKDFETGKDLHAVGNELIFANRQDISRDVTLRTWRGARHQYGQKVRGQHTRSTGRTGATMGVTKKSAMKPGAPAAKSDKK